MRSKLGWLVTTGFSLLVAGAGPGSCGGLVTGRCSDVSLPSVEPGAVISFNQHLCTLANRTAWNGGDDSQLTFGAGKPTWFSASFKACPSSQPCSKMLVFEVDATAPVGVTAIFSYSYLDPVDLPGGDSGKITITTVANGSEGVPLSINSASEPLGDPHGSIIVASAKESGERALPWSTSVDPNSPSVRIKANPDPGWAFSKWTGDCVGSLQEQVLVVSEPTACTVTFVREVGVPITVTFDASRGFVNAYDGTLQRAVTSAEPLYIQSDSATLAAFPRDGYAVDEWSQDCEPDLDDASKATIVPMPGENRVCSVLFAEAHTLTVKLDGPIALRRAVSIRGRQADCGSDSCIFDLPAGDYTLGATLQAGDNSTVQVEWSGEDCNPTFDASTVVTVSGDATCTATFSEPGPCVGTTPVAPTLNVFQQQGPRRVPIIPVDGIYPVLGCQGCEVTIQAFMAGGQAPFTYVWSDANGPMAGEETSTCTWQPPLFTTSATFSVEVTDNCGATTGATAELAVSSL